MPRSATIKSLPRAFRMMKAMQAQGIEWGEDYRHAAGAALKDFLEGRMAAEIDRHLAEMAGRGATDWRNGTYRRWLMTEMGEIELSVPRTRSFDALAVVRAFARRNDLDELLTCFRYRTLAERKAVRTTNAIEKGSERSAAGPIPWASSRTEPAWTESSSPSSHMKT